MVTFEEIPDKVSLSLAISNCKGTCIGCHSPELRQDIGTELTIEELDRLIENECGVNCVLFLGEGRDQEHLLKLSEHIHKQYVGIDTALYSGRENVETPIFAEFDYVKTGPYIAECGPLNRPTTNQRLFKVVHYRDSVNSVDLIDITDKFWKNRF